MITISNRQMTSLDDRQRSRFEETLLESLTDRHAQLARLSPADRPELIHNLVDRALLYGLRSTADVRRFVEFSVIHGPGFETQERWRTVGSILGRTDLPGWDKIDRVEDAMLFSGGALPL